MSETVGKVSSDLIIKSGDNTHSAHEQMSEQLSEYDKNIYICIEQAKKDFPHLFEFYVVVLTKKERLMPNVLRHYYFARASCPTPDYDQTVYHYILQKDHLEFMWVIPSKDTCEYMRHNMLTIPLEEKQLLQFVLDFYDDTLMKKCKKLNDEELETPLIIKG